DVPLSRARADVRGGGRRGVASAGAATHWVGSRRHPYAALRRDGDFDWIPGSDVLHLHQSLCHHRKAFAGGCPNDSPVPPFPPGDWTGSWFSADDGGRSGGDLFVASLEHPTLRADGSGASGARGGKRDCAVHTRIRDLSVEFLSEHPGVAEEVDGS